MNITLTIRVSYPDVATGSARNAIFNAITQSFQVLGSEWNHRITHSIDGSMTIRFEREADVPVQVLAGDGFEVRPAKLFAVTKRDLA